MRIIKLSTFDKYFIAITDDMYILTTGEIINWDTAMDDIGFEQLNELTYFNTKEEAQHIYDKIAKIHPEYTI